MKGLDIKDLEEGTVYECLLSGNNVLVTTYDESVIGLVYSKVTGIYDTVVIWDGQLISVS
jgi:hypothetical protein